MMRLATQDFVEGPWSAPVQKPVEPRVDVHHASPAACPYCHGETQERQRTVDRVLTVAVHQAIFGVVLLVVGAIRICRLSVAAALCLVGFIGATLSKLGLRIAHPDDRRLLERIRPRT